MTALVYTVILIVCTFLIVRKKHEEETRFSLKIIGYFILGSFAFIFDELALPLGFIVYLLFFRPTLNAHVKRTAAVYGVLTFVLVHWIIPLAIHEWEYRSITIEHELGSVYTINFQDEHERIKEELHLNNHQVKLENFKVEYVKNGQIDDLGWQLLEPNDNGYKLYQIRYEIDKSQYHVSTSQVDNWLQYDRLVNGDYFFEILNVLDIKEITDGKGDYLSYEIRSTGERTYYGIENTEHYIIENGEIHVVEDGNLPVEGYYISTFAMLKTKELRDEQGNITEEHFEGTASTDYLFDVVFGE